MQDYLINIEAALEDILGWTAHTRSADDFALSAQGMILLNAVCMKLFVIGEEVKNLDRHSGGTLLPQYPSIKWAEVMRLRDKIAHHYFDIDIELVFVIVSDDLPPLLEVVRQMKKDAAQLAK